MSRRYEAGEVRMPQSQAARPLMKQFQEELGEAGDESGSANRTPAPFCLKRREREVLCG